MYLSSGFGCYVLTLRARKIHDDEYEDGSDALNDNDDSSGQRL